MNDRAILQAAARSEVYGFLALAFADPGSEAPGRLRARWERTEVALEALTCLGEATGCAAALAALTGEGLRQAYAACFGHAVSKDCPPYEAEYGSANIFQKTQTLADIAGFYRAFGLRLALTFRDRPDHIAAELEFMEFLSRKEAYARASGHTPPQIALCRRAQRSFLAEHLGRWAFGLARRVREKAPQQAYAIFAGLLEGFLAREIRALRLKRTGELPLSEGSNGTWDAAECGKCPVSPGATLPERSVQP